MEIEMNHKAILNESIAVLSDRNEQYGEMEDTVIRACEIFELITGREISPYHANMFLHALKLARIKSAPEKLDSYVDGINYLAFAGEFATQPTEIDAINAAMNAEMIEIIGRLDDKYMEQGV